MRDLQKTCLFLNMHAASLELVTSLVQHASYQYVSNSVPQIWQHLKQKTIPKSMPLGDGVAVSCIWGGLAWPELSRDWGVKRFPKNINVFVCPFGAMDGLKTGS